MPKHWTGTFFPGKSDLVDFTTHLIYLVSNHPMKKQESTWWYDKQTYTISNPLLKTQGKKKQNKTKQKKNQCYVVFTIQLQFIHGGIIDRRAYLHLVELQRFNFRAVAYMEILGVFGYTLFNLFSMNTESTGFLFIPFASFLASKQLTYSRGTLFTNIIHKMLKLWDFALSLKGHWTTSASSPIFFQKSWDFYIIRSVYLCSDCMLNLTCSFNSVTKIYAFFFQ